MKKETKICYLIGIVLVFAVVGFGELITNLIGFIKTILKVMK